MSDFDITSKAAGPQVLSVALQPSGAQVASIGLPGPKGDITPELQQLREDTQQASSSAVQSSSEAGLSAGIAAQQAALATEAAAAMEQGVVSIYEGGSIVRRLQDMCAVGKLYIKRVDASNILLGMHTNGTHGTEFQLRLDGDGMLLMRGGFANTLTPATRKVEAANLTGTFVTSSTNASGSYATGIGAYFDLNFTGTGLVFNHFGDNRGGVWRFVIDGGAPVDISTWRASSGVVSTIISAEGTLSAGAHTCRATYQGADPLHPPASGGANGRGWMIYLNVGGAETGSAYVDGPEMVNPTGRAQVMTPNSIPDFAISAKATAFSGAGDWVPLHGATTGAARSITREIRVNGVSVGSAISGFDTVPVEIESFVVSQTYTAYSTNDVAGAYPMWTGNIIHKFDKNGLTVTHKIKTVAEIAALGYFSMLTGDSLYIDRCVFGNGDSFAVAAPGSGTTQTNIAVLSASACFKNNSSKVAVAAQASSLGDVLGLRTQAPIEDSLFLQERSDRIMKVYWKRFNGETIPANQEFRYQTKFFLAANIDSPESL